MSGWIAGVMALLLAVLAPGSGAAQSSSRPTGTQGVEGNPNCPPPVIGGITPRNWSCPTGTKPPAPQTQAARPQAGGRCIARTAAPYRSLRTQREVAQLIFDNYAAGRHPIFIARITNMGNPNFFLVALSGTQVGLDRLQQTTGLGEDILASANIRESFSRSVIRGLEAHGGGRGVRGGVPAGAQLVMVGHSLGGMVAQNLAASRDFLARWKPIAVVTMGSPRTVMLPAGLVKRFAVAGDIVPTLSLAAWGLGGFDVGSQTWIENMPAGRWRDVYTAHMRYPTASDLLGYDALGVASGNTLLVLDEVGQEYCPSRVL